jgi:hypothetical protein
MLEPVLNRLNAEQKQSAVYPSTTLPYVSFVNFDNETTNFELLSNDFVKMNRTFRAMKKYAESKDCGNKDCADKLKTMIQLLRKLTPKAEQSSSVSPEQQETPNAIVKYYSRDNLEVDLESLTNGFEYLEEKLTGVKAIISKLANNKTKHEIGAEVCDIIELLKEHWPDRTKSYTQEDMVHDANSFLNDQIYRAQLFINTENARRHKQATLDEAYCISSSLLSKLAGIAASHLKDGERQIAEVDVYNKMQEYLEDSGWIVGPFAPDIIKKRDHMRRFSNLLRSNLDIGLKRQLHRIIEAMANFAENAGYASVRNGALYPRIKVELVSVASGREARARFKDELDQDAKAYAAASGDDIGEDEDTESDE